MSYSLCLFCLCIEERSVLSLLLWERNLVNSFHRNSLCPPNMSEKTCWYWVHREQTESLHDRHICTLNADWVFGLCWRLCYTVTGHCKAAYNRIFYLSVSMWNIQWTVNCSVYRICFDYWMSYKDLTMATNNFNLPIINIFSLMRACQLDSTFVQCRY